jgi:hypothetical protein
VIVTNCRMHCYNDNQFASHKRQYFVVQAIMLTDPNLAAEVQYSKDFVKPGDYFAVGLFPNILLEFRKV